VSSGINVANGGVGRLGVRDPDFPWQQAAGDARAGQQISQLIDAPVTQAIPGRRLTAWDLMDSRHAHLSLVVPDHILHADQLGAMIRLAPRNIYLVDGIGATPAELAGFLARLESGLATDQLLAEPLSSLG
jgi:hypothetical protein